MSYIPDWMPVYNSIHQFLRGDLIWEIPAIIAGFLVFPIAMIARRTWQRYALFFVSFLILAIALHMTLEPYIHAFQKAWLEPLGPPLVLK